mmetsp:Transcript_12015/g.17394  ORF Transcript_12015/g.17394 Transcript_12015/m.17394 type:complete len:87 (-) Transcript_12015:526-786(-)
MPHLKIHKKVTKAGPFRTLQEVRNMARAERLYIHDRYFEICHKGWRRHTTISRMRYMTMRRFFWEDKIGRALQNVKALNQRRNRGL